MTSLIISPNTKKLIKDYKTQLVMQHVLSLVEVKGDGTARKLHIPKLLHTSALNRCLFGYILIATLLLRQSFFLTWLRVSLSETLRLSEGLFKVNIKLETFWT